MNEEKKTTSIYFHFLIVIEGNLIEFKSRKRFNEFYFQNFQNGISI